MEHKNHPVDYTLSKPEKNKKAENMKCSPYRTINREKLGAYLSFSKTKKEKRFMVLKFNSLKIGNE